MSGGPGDGAIHETEAMKRLAAQLGVPAERIFTDLNGVDSRATVSHTNTYATYLGAQRILAISHFYHLPRIEFEFTRIGVDVLKAPAEQSRVIPSIPYSIAREIPAFWYYWLTPLRD